MSWNPINLAHIGERPPLRPSLCGLVYPGGARHVFSGAPEGFKTWAALIVAVQHIREGGTVAHIDFEMFEFETRDRLRDLGATDEELERFLHIQPEVEASHYVIDELVQWHAPTLVIVDAAAGAYSLQGLDDNARKDVELFAQSFIDPFRVRGISSLLLDHVTKAAESRGKFAIGSERKIGGADVHLGFEVVVPFGRGRSGLAKVSTHKDRFGYLRRPILAELELRSDPDTFEISWQIREPAQTDAETWQPTHQMERVSRYVEHQAEPVSLRNIEANVSGKRRDVIRKAVESLLATGHISESPGNRGARMFTHLRPFTTSPDLAPTSPGEVPTDLAHLARPLQGGEVRGEVRRSNTGWGEVEQTALVEDAA